MSVYVTNIVINSGADFLQNFTLDFNLTNYSVFSQMRKYPNSPNAVSFASTVITPSAQSVVSIGLTSGDTLSLKPGRYVYDVLIQSPTGTKTRVIEGMALVSEGVTRL